LDGCLNITEFTLSHPNIRSLSLSRCSNLKTYQPTLPKLKSINLVETNFDLFQNKFSKNEWNTFLGDVGQEPPLPPDIEEILNSPCPFWPDQKVWETHFLCLIPKTVNGDLLTLNSLNELVQHPKQGTPTKYSYYSGHVQKEHGSTAVKQSHWVLMTKDVIPDSRFKSYDEQKALVEKTSNYQLPPVLEAATVIFLYTYKTGGYIYTDNMLGPQYTYTRCLEKVNNGNWPVIAGGHSAAGLSVSFNDFDVHDYGAAGFRKFQ